MVGGKEVVREWGRGGGGGVGERGERRSREMKGLREEGDLKHRQSKRKGCTEKMRESGKEKSLWGVLRWKEKRNE